MEKIIKNPVDVVHQMYKDFRNSVQNHLIVDAPKRLEKLNHFREAFVAIGAIEADDERWTVESIDSLFSAREHEEIYVKAWTRGVSNGLTPYSADYKDIKTFLRMFDYKPGLEVIADVFCQQFHRIGRKYAFEYLQMEAADMMVPVPKELLALFITDTPIIVWQGNSISKSEMGKIIDSTKEIFIWVTEDMHNILRLWQ